ncbi:hypothetical protein LINPERPRIM_LOCUS38083, partial [Linum perenne]
SFDELSSPRDRDKSAQKLRGRICSEGLSGLPPWVLVSLVFDRSRRS